MSRKSVTDANRGIPENRKIAFGIVATVAAVSLLTPWVPIGIAGWVIAVMWLRMYPPGSSDRWEPFSVEATRAAWHELRRLHIWHGLRGCTWTLGAAGDNDGSWGNQSDPHPEQERQPLRRPRTKKRDNNDDEPVKEPEPRLVALNTVAALLAAASAVGVEMLRAQMVGLLPWPNSGPLADVERTWQLSAIVLPAVAAPFGWMTAKTVAAYRRMRVAAETMLPEDGLSLPEKPKTSAPTAFLSNPHLFKDEPSWFSHVTVGAKLGWGAAAFTLIAIPTVPVAMLAPQWIVPVLLTVAPLAVMFAGSRMLTDWGNKQREQWIAWQREIIEWDGHWATVISDGKAFPLLSDSSNQASSDETGPLMKLLVFAMATGIDYQTVAGLTDKLKPALGCDLVQIFPGVVAGAREATWSFIYLSHELPEYQTWCAMRERTWQQWIFNHQIEVDKQTAYHDPALPPEMRRFLLARQLSRTMSDLKIGVLLPGKSPRVRSNSQNKPAYLMFEVPLFGKTTFSALKANTHKIGQQLQAGWLRWSLLSSDNVAVGHLCAVHPNELEYNRSVDRNVRNEIEQLDWQYAMETAKMFGSDGTSVPEMIEAETVTRKADDPESDIRKLRFRLPTGLTYDRVVAAEAKLAVASEYAFVSAERERLPSEVTVLAGHRDPLNDTYPFDDHADHEMPDGRSLIAPPQQGNPRIGWCVGVGVDGAPISMEWDHEEPHLLIAGASGSGKSMVINSMLTQMLSNNTPEDVQLWMLEPKNELHRYANKSHVQVFLDNHIADGSIYENAEATFNALVREMERRYAIMQQHPQQPQKIAEARKIAQEDSTQQHLNFPWIFLVVEECTEYFGKPATKEEQQPWNRMIEAVTNLARKSRASGIHMVFATQNPTKDAIPTQLKRNCRRIGLRTSDRMGSMVIIDQPGLEVITEPGRGLVSSSVGYVGYRAFFLPLETLTNRLNQVADSHTEELKLPPGVQPAQTVDVAYEPEIDRR